MQKSHVFEHVAGAKVIFAYFEKTQVATKTTEFLAFYNIQVYHLDLDSLT